MASILDQIIDELEKPVSRDIIISQLEQDPSYLALPTQDLKDQFVDRTVDASNTQKGALVAQLEAAKDTELTSEDLPSREDSMKAAYETLTKESPIIQEMRRYFGLFFLMSVWFTVVLFKVFLALFGALYGYLFLQLFETGGMF